MLRQLSHLQSDDRGFVVSAELVLIATIVVLALVVGLTTVRTAIIAELVDVANAFGSINQSFHCDAKHGSNTGSFHDDSDDLRELRFIGPRSE